VNLGAMMTRLNDAVTYGVGGRREIWAITRTMIGDFWLTGVGVGAYARAMSAYQPPHVFAFNHAHDEYLQVIAEGGVLLASAVLAAVVAGAVQGARLLRADRTAMFWMRAGAVSAAIAIATQSVWDTGVRMPANGLLLALCCAIALHRSATA
jgi:O-antigen ligase